MGRRGGGGGGQTVNTEDGYRNVRSMTPATLGRGGGGSVGVRGGPVAGGGSSHVQWNSSCVISI